MLAQGYLLPPFSPLPPTECDCDSLGSNGTTCDQTTGQCQCLLNVEGLKCDHCATNHYGISSGLGCTPCDCSGEGSSTIQCDVVTGECVCRPGVTGRTCDQCLPGFFGLSGGGCRGTHTICLWDVQSTHSSSFFSHVN